MRHSQRGVTLIGWLFLLTPIAILFYAGIRLTPIYLNYMRVSKALSQLASEVKGTEATALNAQMLRNSLAKRFDVGYIDHPDVKDIDIHREGDHWVAIAEYDDNAPLFGNLTLDAQFYKEVELQ